MTSAVGAGTRLVAVQNLLFCNGAALRCGEMAAHCCTIRAGYVAKRAHQKSSAAFDFKRCDRRSRGGARQSEVEVEAVKDVRWR